VTANGDMGGNNRTKIPVMPHIIAVTPAARIALLSIVAEWFIRSVFMCHRLRQFLGPVPSRTRPALSFATDKDPVVRLKSGVNQGASASSFASSMSAAFSAIAITAALVLPRTIEGITEASATRKPSVSKTRRSESTTRPIAQVLVG
jgi:hypothetical protein